MIELIYDHECTRCPLHLTVPANETVCVSGSGDWTSKGMILGEAPGAEESRTGVPFVGSSGKILEQALIKTGISRSHLFVTNTVKCRPPDNRKPEQLEEDKCRKFLLQELEIVNPLAILALGNHALRSSTGLWGITKYVGIWQSVPRKNKDNLLVMPCFHPAYIRRNRSLMSDFETIIEIFVLFVKGHSEQRDLHLQL